MNSTIRNAERMSLDDFEELLLNRPKDEKWELSVSGGLSRHRASSFSPRRMSFAVSAPSPSSCIAAATAADACAGL
jgi:hypothetical protein